MSAAKKNSVDAVVFEKKNWMYFFSIKKKTAPKTFLGAIKY